MAPYKQSVGKAVFWTLFGVFALGEYVMQCRGRFNRTGKRTERWSLYAVLACVVGGMVAGLKLAG